MKSMAPSFAEQGIRGRNLKSKIKWSNSRGGSGVMGNRGIAKFLQIAGFWLRLLVPIILVGDILLCGGGKDRSRRVDSSHGEYPRS